MRANRLLIVGVALVVVGFVGILGTALVVGGPVFPFGTEAVDTGSATVPGDGVPGDDVGRLTDEGRDIFLNGADDNGRPIGRSGGRMMGRGGDSGCASCHGDDARGREIRMMGRRVQSADIRWSALTTPGAHGGEGGGHEPFDERSFARAVREGIGPDGEALDRLMPHWDLTNRQIEALIAYLKTL